MVVIGDEILNGFTAEINMAVAAKALSKRFSSFFEHLLIEIVFLFLHQFEV